MQCVILCIKQIAQELIRKNNTNGKEIEGNIIKITILKKFNTDDKLFTDSFAYPMRG